MPNFRLPTLPGQQSNQAMDRFKDAILGARYRRGGLSLGDVPDLRKYVAGNLPAFDQNAYLNALTAAAPSGNPQAWQAAGRGNSPLFIDPTDYAALQADPRYKQAEAAYHNSANQIAYRQKKRDRQWYQDPRYQALLAVGGAGLAGTLIPALGGGLATGAGAAGAASAAGAAGATVPALGAGGPGVLGAIAPFEYGAGAAGLGAAGAGAAGAAAAAPWYNTFWGQTLLNTGGNLLSGALGNRAQKGAESRNRKDIEKRIRQALEALSPEHIAALAQQFLPQAAANANAAGQTAIQAVREQAARTGQLESPRALSFEAGTRAKLAGDVQQAAFDRAFGLAGNQASAITGAPYVQSQPRTGYADAITNSLNAAWFEKVLRQRQQQQPQQPAGVPYLWPQPQSQTGPYYGTPLNTPPDWMGGY